MPVIVPVPGARAEERVLENFTDIYLSDEDLKEIKSILDNFPIAGDLYHAAGAKLTKY
jgi:pyridoxine 4-dehydrogenase